MPSAVILTALPIEYQAVRAHLTGLRRHTDPRGTVYEQGRFRARGHDWDVAIVEVGKGNVAAAIEAERVIQRFAPDVALFVGVAGGLKDVHLGDVVAATKVYGYESGKDEAEFRPRPELHNANYGLVQQARVVSRNSAWRRRIRGGKSSKPPQARVAPIAAGEKVVAARESATAGLIKANYGDAAAVEMEGYGFLEAVYANTGVRGLVIRGISDLIVGKAEADAGGSQNMAARHASAFAFEVLAALDGNADTRIHPVAEPSRPSDGLPEVWNVPYLRNPNFTGREDLLGQIEDSFRTGTPAVVVQPRTVHGLGGIGKTQLAVEFAYRHAADYNVVWWIRAEEPTTIAAELARLAAAIALPEAAMQDQDAAIEAIRRRLEQNPEPWLLVFDNAEEPEHVRPFLPRAGAGSVLVTSRNPNWLGVGEAIKVDVLSEPDAVAFLLMRTGRTDQEAATILARELGGLPLALEQAGAFIEATGISIGDYLRLLEQREGDMLGRGMPSNYPDTVASTWELSFRQVEMEAPAAAALLRLCSFFAPEAIPLGLLAVTAHLLPEPLQTTLDDVLGSTEAVATLRRYSLVGVEDDLLSMHRLVQSVTIHRMSETDQRLFVEAAVAVINAVFPAESLDVETWWICANLLPHALTATWRAIELGVISEHLGRLLNHVGQYLRGRAQFADALPLLERARAIAEQLYGTSHPNLAAALGNLGDVRLALGDFEGAVECHRQALEIVEAAYGKVHSAVATALAGYAHALWQMDRLPEARPLLERAVAISEEAEGPDHPETALILNSLGDLLRELREIEEALPILERALRILVDVRGDDHPSTSLVRSNLALVVAATGDLEAARSLLMRALHVAESGYGADHPDTAAILANLAGVERDLGLLPAAREHFERSLAVEEAIYGREHPILVLGLHGLGQLCHRQKDLLCARECFERALEIAEGRYGADSPRLANLHNEYALVLEDLGEVPRAVGHLERAVTIAARVNDWLVADEAVFANNLGNAQRRLGNLHAARPWHQRAVVLAGRSDYPNQANFALFLSQLGSLLWALGDRVGARAKIKKSFRVARAAYSPEHPLFGMLRLNAESFLPSELVATLVVGNESAGPSPQPGHSLSSPLRSKRPGGRSKPRRRRR